QWEPRPSKVSDWAPQALGITRKARLDGLFRHLLPKLAEPAAPRRLLMVFPDAARPGANTHRWAEIRRKNPKTSMSGGNLPTGGYCAVRHNPVAAQVVAASEPDGRHRPGNAVYMGLSGPSPCERPYRGSYGVPG